MPRWWFLINTGACAFNVGLASLTNYPSINLGVAVISGMLALRDVFDESVEKLVARGVAKAMLREASARVDSSIGTLTQTPLHIAALNKAIQQAVAQANANPGSTVTVQIK